MKKSIITLLIVGFVLALHAKAMAQNSRQGFTFTLEIPGVGLSHHPDQDDGSVFAMAGAIRFGYGVNKQFIPFIESTGSLGPIGSTDWDSKGILLATWTIGLQYFPMQDRNFFITPKAGLGIVTVFNEDLGVHNDREGAGFAGGLGAGYEWRFLKSFALSPEARFDYYNIHGASAFFSGIALNLQWY